MWLVFYHNLFLTSPSPCWCLGKAILCVCGILVYFFCDVVSPHYENTLIQIY